VKKGIAKGPVAFERKVWRRMFGGNYSKWKQDEAT